MEILRLCDVVRETSFAIHCYHRNGHLEKVYENALAHRLGKLGLRVQQQHPLPVYDEDGTLLGDYTPIYILKNVWLSNSKPAGHCAMSTLHNY